MRYVLWLASAAAATLLSGCAVYPAGPVATAPPGVVYGTPGAVAAAPYPYAYGYPYDYYAYGYPGYYYGPPVFFSGSLGFVYGAHGHGHGHGSAHRGGSGGVHLIPRQLRR